MKRLTSIIIFVMIMTLLLGQALGSTLDRSGTASEKVFKLINTKLVKAGKKPNFEIEKAILKKFTEQEMVNRNLNINRKEKEGIPLEKAVSKLEQKTKKVPVDKSNVEFKTNFKFELISPSNNSNHADRVNDKCRVALKVGSPYWMPFHIKVIEISRTKKVYVDVIWGTQRTNIAASRWVKQRSGQWIYTNRIILDCGKEYAINIKPEPTGGSGNNQKIIPKVPPVGNTSAKFKTISLAMGDSLGKVKVQKSEGVNASADSLPSQASIDIKKTDEVSIQSKDGINQAHLPDNLIKKPITLKAPKGGQEWHKGDDMSIIWEAPNLTGNVRVFLYKGGEQYKRLTSKKGVLATDGKFIWEISNDEIPLGKDYKIRVVSRKDASIMDESGIFSITRHKMTKINEARGINNPQILFEKRPYSLNTGIMFIVKGEPTGKPKVECFDRGKWSSKCSKNLILQKIGAGPQTRYKFKTKVAGKYRIRIGKLLSDEIKVGNLGKTVDKKVASSGKQPAQVTPPAKRSPQEKKQTKIIQKNLKDTKKKMPVKFDKPKFSNLNDGQIFPSGSTLLFNLKLNPAFKKYEVKYEVYQNECKGKPYKVSTKNNFGKLPAGNYCVRAAYLGGEKMNWSKGISFMVEKEQRKAITPKTNKSSRKKMVVQ